MTPLLHRPWLVRTLAPVIVGVLILCAWQAGCRVFAIPTYLFPAPGNIAASLHADLPTLLRAVLSTLRVTLLALAIATIIGTLVAFLFVQSRAIKVSLLSYAIMLKVTPIVAVAPLIILLVKDVFWSLTICPAVIAVFPIISNITIGLRQALHRSGAAFALPYCAHDRATAPFLTELEQGPFVVPHLTADGPLARFDAAAALARAPGADVYACGPARMQEVCGPARLQDGVAEAFASMGWGPARPHRERFTADVERGGDPFTVVAARSGVTVNVPPDRSIAQVLAEHGVMIPISCEQGVCGTCVTRVIKGTVDHRDLFLMAAQKVANAG